MSCFVLLIFIELSSGIPAVVQQTFLINMRGSLVIKVIIYQFHITKDVLTTFHIPFEIGTICLYHKTRPPLELVNLATWYLSDLHMF